MVVAGFSLKEPDAATAPGRGESVTVSASEVVQSSCASPPGSSALSGVVKEVIDGGSPMFTVTDAVALPNEFVAVSV